MSVFIITLLRSSTRSRLILFVNVDKVVCWTSWAVSCVLWQEGNLCGGFATQTYTYLLDRYSGELWFVSKSGFQRWWNLKQSYHPGQSQRTPTVVKECSCRVLTNHIAAFYHVTASGPIRWLDLHIQDGWHEKIICDNATTTTTTTTSSCQERRGPIANQTSNSSKDVKSFIKSFSNTLTLTPSKSAWPLLLPAITTGNETGPIKQNRLATTPGIVWRSNQSVHQSLEMVSKVQTSPTCSPLLTQYRICNARNKGDVCVASHLVDGLDLCDPATVRPSIYEFHGCLRHGCPRCFSCQL